MNTDNIKQQENGEILDAVQANAEELFRSGTFFCSESVVHTINEFLGNPYDESIVKMASGFPIGMGKAGCICGAVSGGQMALGMAYGRVKGEAMNDLMFERAKELHDFIKNEYKSTCCRVITKEWAGDNFKSEGRRNHCIKITGQVARWAAEKIMDDGKMEVK